MNAVPQRVTLPPDLAAKLRERGVNLDAIPVAPDADSIERAEDVAERRRVQAEHRAARWASRRPAMYAQAALEDVLADDAQAPAGVKARDWWANPEALTLILAGSIGTGKTHLAYALGNHAVSVGRWVEVWRVSELLEDMRPNGDAAARDRARECDLLVLDDLDALNVTPWAVEALTAVLDARVAAQRRQVLTTNLPATVLEEAWGGRLVDRLLYRSVPVTMAGPSRRRAAW